MKFLECRKNVKIICLILAIITIMNVFTPICSYADEDSDNGGKLFKPVFKLFAFVGDLVIKGLQSIFIGDGDIAFNGISEIEQESEFLIRYSPAVIFSGEVPALDANFINPGADKEVIKYEGKWKKTGENFALESDGTPTSDTLTKKYGYDPSKATIETVQTDTEWYSLLGSKDHAIISWNYNGVSYKLIDTTHKITKTEVLGFIGSASGNLLSMIKTFSSLGRNNW